MCAALYGQALQDGICLHTTAGALRAGMRKGRQWRASPRCGFLAARKLFLGTQQAPFSGLGWGICTAAPGRDGSSTQPCHLISKMGIIIVPGFGVGRGCSEWTRHRVLMAGGKVCTHGSCWHNLSFHVQLWIIIINPHLVTALDFPEGSRSNWHLFRLYNKLGRICFCSKEGRLRPREVR